MRQVCQKLKETERRVHKKIKRDTPRGKIEGAGPILGSNKTNEEKKKVPQKKQKQKADVFRRVFKSIIWIIRELWLEHNMDRHRPLQLQKRMAKITEATQTVTVLYSL